MTMRESFAKHVTQSKIDMKNTPACEVRIGALKAAVWENPTSNGTFYSVTFQRLYRDPLGWNTTKTFGRDDLLTLAKVADMAHTWICGRQSEQQDVKSTNTAVEAN